MENNKIKHFSNCTSDYSEKPEGEEPQHIEVMDIGDGEFVHQCTDCGAHIICEEETRDNEKT